MGGTLPFVSPCCLIVGVCNTDNFSLLSITIDYGPFGFMDSYDPNFVPNTSDDEGRYKIGNQANVGLFNLNKLLQALKPLLDPRQKQLASHILEEYGQTYYVRYAVPELTPCSPNPTDYHVTASLLCCYFQFYRIVQKKTGAPWRQ